MRHPLIRPGGGHDALTETYERIATQRRELHRMIDTATAPDDQQARRQRGLIGNRSAAGDEHRLRGIPAIAPGVPGAVPGTAPHRDARP